MDEDYVRRIVITRLSLSHEHCERLNQTITRWSRGFQLATDMAWEKCKKKPDRIP